jgi:hypothetical protein
MTKRHATGTVTKRPALPTVSEAPTVDLMVAAGALGVSKHTAYEVLAPAGRLCPDVPILRVGGRWRVPTAPLRRALGLDVEQADTDSTPAA